MEKHYSAEKLEKKMKFKAWLKKKKVWFIVYGVFLVVGIIAWIAGSYLSGANPIEWLSSDYAKTWYICLIVGAVLLGLIMWLVKMYKKNKGGNNL